MRKFYLFIFFFDGVGASVLWSPAPLVIRTAYNGVKRVENKHELIFRLLRQIFFRSPSQESKSGYFFTPLATTVTVIAVDQDCSQGFFRLELHTDVAK